MITFQKCKGVYKVYLSGQKVGQINSVKGGGFQYTPKGQKEGGEVFTTVDEVKQSLEN